MEKKSLSQQTADRLYTMIVVEHRLSPGEKLPSEVELARELEGKSPIDFPRETAMGALALYISDPSVVNFQPMNVNFGLIPPLGYRVKGKRNKNAELSKRALEALGQLDLVTCNPPYKAYQAGIESQLTAQKIARHEVLCNIYDICRSAKRLLRFGGRLCICNRPERLADCMDAMRQNGIEPKRLQFVAKAPDAQPWLFLLEGRSGSNPFLNVLPQRIVGDGSGVTTRI